MNDSFVAIIPILICFLLVIIFKNAFIAIASGIGAALVIVFMSTGQIVIFDVIGEVFSSTATMKTTLFILIVGAIISAMECSGGIKGMIAYLEGRHLNIKSKVGVQLFTMLLGMLMFVDATSSMAMTSVVGKPLFQKAGIKTEKLALIVNSTGSPIAWLIPFGGAGALTAGLMSQHEEIGANAFAYVIQAVPYQFYSLVLLILLTVTIILKVEIGTLRKIEFKDEEIIDNNESIKSGSARNMVLPLACLFIGIVAILLITGKGSIMAGDSASAVFYSGIATLAITMIYLKIKGTSTIKQTLKWYYRGIKSMFAVTMLLVFAFIFSNLLSRIGTAQYLVGLFDVVSPKLLPCIALLLSAIIAFCTGTSGGTVTVVTALIIPMALLQGSSIPLVIGAIISGSVFGDQNSIISDSVILTSSLTGVDAVTHVKTQLPYTLITLAISTILYLTLGFMA